MTLHQLKHLLSRHGEKNIQLRLPDRSFVPGAFHVTEVAHVRKSLIDCGGRRHAEESCQLQAWNGTDDEHRITGAKLAKILGKAANLFSRDDVDLEIEYEDELISQYLVKDWEADRRHLILNLSQKHTTCRAKEVCSPPKSSEPCCDGACACAA